MKKKFFILGLAALISFNSCTDEPEAPKDKTAPVITLLSPNVADFYQDNLLISAMAVDDEAVVVMQIFFDDVMIDSQPAEEIGYIINTQQFEDGEHKIKIVAVDAAGNESTVEKSITLLNTVITLNLVASNPQPNFEYFFYLLDQEGLVVEDKVYQVVANSTQVKFSTPQNHTLNKKYSLAYFDHGLVNSIGSPSNRIIIVTGYTQGIFNITLGTPPFVPINPIGTHTVNFQNLPNPLPTAYHTEVSQMHTSEVSGSQVLSLEKNDADAYMAIMPDNNQAPLYKIFSGLNVGQSTIVSATDFTVMNGVRFPALPNTNTFSFVYGLKTAGDFQNPKMVWSYNLDFTHSINEFQMYYPENHFAEYYSGMFESPSSTYADLYLSYDQTPPTEFKKLSAQITSLSMSNGVLTIKSEGNYDFLELSGGHYNTEGNYSWRIYLSNDSDLTFKLPKVPQQLMEMYGYPPSLVWDSNVNVTLNDYSGLTGYGEYFNTNFTFPPANFFAWGLHSRDWLIRSLWITPTGGRIKSLDPSMGDLNKSEIWTRMFQNIRH